MPDKSKPVPEITPNITGFNVIPAATTPAVVLIIAEVLIIRSVPFNVMFIVHVVTCF